MFISGENSDQTGVSSSADTSESQKAAKIKAEINARLSTLSANPQLTESERSELDQILDGKFAEQPMDKEESRFLKITVVSLLALLAFGSIFIALNASGHLNMTSLQAVEWVAAPIVGGSIIASAVAVYFGWDDPDPKKVSTPTVHHTLQNEDLPIGYKSSGNRSSIHTQSGDLTTAFGYYANRK